MQPTRKRRGSKRKWVRKLRARSWPLRGFASRVAFGRKNDEALKNARSFFVLGYGRSGTQWLSQTLALDPHALVLHEPDAPEDMEVMQAAMHDEASGIAYFERYRKHRIAARIRESGAPVYGEVNGMLRYHYRAIAKTIPDAAILSICRDARNVVRSVMSRPFYVAGARGAFNLAPVPHESVFAEWNTFDRFAKICWNWADSYDRLLREVPPHRHVQFEKLLTDYAYFRSKVLEPTGVMIDEAIWKNAASTPSKNATQEHKASEWSEWSRQERDTFDQICGPVMRRLGYDYGWGE